MMRDDEKTVTLYDCQVEVTTAKAYLIHYLGGEYWIPKSQVVSKTDADPDGNCIFEITDWIARKNGLNGNA